jgi:DNA invertase Pin-like site-specific DNA recombinase
MLRHKEDSESPERQRANIQSYVDEMGWTAEWYEDVGGHRSGRSEKNRPQWLALLSRLGDPDVVAVIANDQSRLSRSSWRTGRLLEQVRDYNLKLVFARERRSLDITNSQAVVQAKFMAVFDELFADKRHLRQKDSIAYRKRLGKVIGQPPFDTVRNKEGYLSPSQQGAWLLPDGKHIAGEENNCPIEGAQWRGYYHCAEQILTLFAEGQKGLEKIAYHLTNEGWVFKDRWGQPRRLERDDIRRVVANWPEYGGVVTGKRSKDRPAYEDLNLDEIPFREDRAAFPLDLLRQVASVRKGRSIEPADRSVKKQAIAYPFSNMLYCSHCEQIAREQDNPRLRTRLTGRVDNNIRRYKHKDGLKCGCHNRSVPASDFERDFTRLIELLEVRPEVQAFVYELARQIEVKQRDGGKPEDIEAKKQAAIAQCRVRINNNIYLFQEGHISQEEFQRVLERNNREIAEWEAIKDEVEETLMDMMNCISNLRELTRVWREGTDEDKQAIIRSIFVHLSYNLDTRRLEEFEIQPWAHRFLQLRADLYEDDGTEIKNSAAFKDLRNEMPLQGLQIITRTQLEQMLVFTQFVARRLYNTYVLPNAPVSHRTPEQIGRNTLIRERFRAGEDTYTLAEEYGISLQRVYQILHHHRN